MNDTDKENAMDRNKQTAQDCERTAKEDNYQAHADYLRDEVKRGTPVYKPVKR